METYQKDYEDFMDAYELSGGSVSTQEIGAMITKMAKSYAQYNNIANVLVKPYNKLRAAMANSKDEMGKPIAVSKAEILVDASPEKEAYQDAATALKNIEMYISALTRLQYGTSKEYGISNNA